MPTVPATNLTIYETLFFLEVGLRELIIDKLSAYGGPKWYKHHLPGDILQKYRSGLASEKNIPWLQLVPHHPIYYIDFPHLKKIIELQNNWQGVFEPIFKRKEIITAELSKLESIRNKIAHSRKTSNKDLELVKMIYSEIEQMIGKEYFNALILKSSLQCDIASNLSQLATHIKTIYDTILHCKEIKKSDFWINVSNSWWFDETYLEMDLTPINDFFINVDQYISIPHTRGCGYILEAWIMESAIIEKFTLAENVILKLLKDWRNENES